MAKTRPSRAPPNLFGRLTPDSRWRRLKRELRHCAHLISESPQDDRARGQMEMLRHIVTVIELLEHRW